jgi:hypothetical protein
VSRACRARLGNQFSGKKCRFLLFQYRAAVACPLLRFATLAPRLPLPSAKYRGTIYEHQRVA